MLRVSLLLLAAALTLGCGSWKPIDGPNVVIVLVDQLRFDAAEMWMPKTRALAEKGVRFEQMRSVAPWTYPSVISMFSGLYPQQHGADGDMGGKTMTTFSEGVPLLPRFLREAGYYTAGFVTNPFLHEWNPFYRSFDEYQANEFINSQENLRGLGAHVWKDTMWANTVNPAVLKHFGERTYEEPEFTYVHYIDVHGRKAGAERWDGAPFEGSYEASCRYIDERIAELYEFFHARYGGDLVFLVTSDHGEDFGDDEDVGAGRRFRQKKSTVHDFNLRIPCYILPGNDVPASVLQGPSGNLDITPTLLEWVGLQRPSVLSGVSLYGALQGQPYDGEARALYAKMSYNGRHNDCMVLGGKKYLRHFDPKSGKVAVRRSFDLGSDPREIQNLGSNFGPQEGQLEKAASDRGYALPAIFEDRKKELLQALNGLGYGGDDDDQEQ